MRHRFCTLFDVNYLPRGLALYRSLRRVCADFSLHVVCMDEASERVLRALDLPDLVVVPLTELERHDGGLGSVRGDRTPVEYCWTATPAVCLYVLETELDFDKVTYLDADLRFFSNPQPLYDELGDDSVLIVPHRYAPAHRYKEATSGTYNVEWLTFRRDDRGLAALRWWRERCIEWCYARYEDGKMGDQKYLDGWPQRFQGVHVLEHPGGGLAPWNVEGHTLSEEGGEVRVDGRPLVFYHYHSLRLFRPTLVARAAAALGAVRQGVPPAHLPWTTNYPVPPPERRLVWAPYLAELGEAARDLARVAPGTELAEATLPLGEAVRKLVRSGARRARRAVRAAETRLDPRSRLPGWTERYRDSWKSGEVARQMRELTDEQLRDPDAVAPYTAFRQLVELLLAEPGLPRPARFLDIGCGAGAYGDLLERWAGDRFTYVGADYSEEVVSAARARAPGRSFEQRDVYAAGALDGFDVVFASALVDVLADYEQALDALFRADAPRVLLHRQRIATDLRVELARGYRGQHTYRSYVTLAELERIAARHGRRVAASVRVDGDVHSFLLVRDGG